MPTCAANGNCAADQACVDSADGFSCVSCAAGTTSSGGGVTSCNDICADTVCEAFQACTAGACAQILTGLTASAGTIVFDPATTSYTTDVTLSVSELTVTATVVDGATLTINDVATASGLPSDPIALALGTTSIAIAATLGDHTVTYTFDVVRAADVEHLAYLKANPVRSSDDFGYAVAISGDLLVVGGELIDGVPSNSSASAVGAAYVFGRENGAWVEQAFLKAENAEADDQFGYAVDIDGETVVVGAPYESGGPSSTSVAPDNDASSAGAAYVFARDSFGSWQQQAYLKASNAGFVDTFGTSVAIHGDTVVVGAPQESGSATSTAASPNNSASSAGAAYVFVRSGSTWSQQGYLKASNAEAGDRLGCAVAVDGDTVVVGAYREDGDAASTAMLSNEDATDSGAAYVFVRSDSLWSQQGYLKATNAADGSGFGYAVAIDGDTVAVGAFFEHGDATSTVEAPNGNAVHAGAAYIFVRDASAWTQQAYLKAANAAMNDWFGFSVALDGDTLVVGAHNEDGDATSTTESPNDDADSAGAVYVFARAGTAWSQQAYIKAPNGELGDQFGFSVGLDGDTLVCGAPGEAGDDASTVLSSNNNTPGAGAGYVFSL